MIRIAVYGSLRKDEYNYNHFKEYYNKFKYQSTHKLKGWELYDFGSYPGAIYTRSNDTLIVDVLLISKDAKESIDAMETSAGYVIRSVEINNELVDIYEFSNHEYCKNHYKKVIGGDWSKHKNQE